MARLIPHLRARSLPSTNGAMAPSPGATNIVVSIQSRGSAVWAGVAAVANARLIACFDSAFSALGSGETNRDTPVLDPNGFRFTASFLNAHFLKAAIQFCTTVNGWNAV